MSARTKIYIAAGLAGIGTAIAVFLGGGDAVQTLGGGGVVGLLGVAAGAGWKAYRGVIEGDADGDGTSNADDSAPLDPERQ